MLKLPVYKVSPAIERVTHRCSDRQCRRCPCADGYHCEGWKTERVQAADGGSTGLYDHTVSCVQDRRS